MPLLIAKSLYFQKKKKLPNLYHHTKPPSINFDPLLAVIYERQTLNRKLQFFTRNPPCSLFDLFQLNNNHDSHKG
jgi:hypothetical protein